MGTRGKVNAIWWNIKINLQKIGWYMSTWIANKFEKFIQKDLTEVKIFQKVLGVLFKHSVGDEF